jgi:hypothetical protein
MLSAASKLRRRRTWDQTMSHLRLPSPAEQARGADRFYGFFLLLLALASAAAPMFVEATLAWTLFLAGLAGLSWLALDRSPRGFVAAAGWALVALGMGLHLVFHAFLGMISLSLVLGLGFVLLGAAEIAFGVERYRPGGARWALVVGGAIAAGFGLSVPLIWPALPTWAGSAAMAVMFAGFGAALLIGAARVKADAASD